MKKRSTIHKICQTCSKEFFPFVENEEKSKFCCRKCFHLSAKKKPRIPLTCKVCNKIYTKNVCQQAKSSFCSRKCQQSLKGKDHYLWGTRDKLWSYVKVGREITNECEICKSTSKKLDIHHIDKNRHNCTRENLCKLCRSCHHKVHVLLRRGVPYIDAVKNFFHFYSQLPISITKRHKPFD